MASNNIRMRVLLNVEGKNTVVEVSSSVKELQGALMAAKSKADRFKESMNTLSNISTLGRNAMDAIQGLGAAMQPFIDKANNAVVVQTKLKTVMEQRMKATQGDVASINKLVSAQTSLGIVGGTVQRAGLQQVATFASHKETLETLLPAMNNLIAQQKGLNATSEDAVTIANMMGKALMGNAGAMTRVGITLTDAQKEMIRTGTEGQRAAAIAQAINENVGQMNRRLAETDAGKVKQMANEFGGLQVKVGQFFAEYQNVIAGVGQVGMAVSGITSLGSAIMGLWKGLGLATLASKAFGAAQVSFSAMGSLVTAMINGQTLSLTALRAGIKGTIMSLGLIGVAYMAVSTVVEALCTSTGLLGDKTSSVTDATQKMTSAQREAAAQNERSRKAGQLMTQAVGDVVGKFETLQAEWKKLKTGADQTKWIKKNQGAFAELGFSIGDVNAAQRVFVTNAPKVINALKAIAEADAYKEEYGKAKVAQARWEAGHQTVVTARPHVGDRVTAEEARGAGLTLRHASRMGNSADSWWRLDDDASVNAVRNYRISQARSKWQDTHSGYSKSSDFWGAKMTGAYNRAEAGRAFLSRIGSPYHGANEPLHSSGLRNPAIDGGGAGVGNSGTDTRTAVEKAYEEREEKIKKLQDEYVSNPGRREAIAQEIAGLKEENKQVDELRAKAKGEWQAPVVAVPDTATGKGGMSSSTIDAWRGMKQDELANTDLGTSEGMAAGVKIVADMDSMDTLQEAVENALSQGVTLPTDAVQGLYDSIFNSEDIPTDQLQAWVDTLNEQLEKAGLGKLALKVDSKGTKKITDGGKEAKESWQDAARAVQSVGGALAGIEDPAVKIAGTIAQAIAEIALSFASALNQKESKAGGVWGWIAAAAAGTATMISTIAAVKGATRHAGGGIVGGNTPSGDLQPVLLNSGELILNKAQQGALASQMQESRQEETGRLPYVTGEEIYLGLSNYLRRRGYGEIVTTRR